MTLSAVMQAIDAAVKEAGRAPQDVTLVAVCKQQPIEAITHLLDAGHRVFGESRVQEASTRWAMLRPLYPDVKLHLIGHVQTNKADEAVALFDCIETIDSSRLADAVALAMRKQSRQISCFIQVNTGEETQKGGVLPKDLESLYHYCTQDAGLKIEGLMCIPPVEDIADLHFALLKTWADRLKVPHLSMGMSADFPQAIRYGATRVRIGTALFGPRAA